MSKTTINLRLTLSDRWKVYERHIRDGAFGAAMVVALLLIHSLLRPAPEGAAPIVMREVQRPALLIATATQSPPQPTATPIVEIREVIVQAPAPEPEIVYVSAPGAAYAAPTVAPIYQTASEPGQPTAPPEAPENGGGGGKSKAPEFGPLSGDWCAAADSAGVARCTEGRP